MNKDKILYFLVTVCFFFGGYLFLKLKAPVPVPVLVQGTPSSQMRLKDHLLLSKGVQHYCVKNFELASCLAYAIECGEECEPLLPFDVRKKMFNEYNKYLLASGEEPLESSSVIGSSPF